MEKKKSLTEDWRGMTGVMGDLRGRWAAEADDFPISPINTLGRILFKSIDVVSLQPRMKADVSPNDAQNPLLP